MNWGFSWLSGCQSNSEWIDTTDLSLPALTLTFLLLRLKIQNSMSSSDIEFGKQYGVIVSNKQCCGREQEEEGEAQGSRDKERGGGGNLDSSALLEDHSWVHSAHLWQNPPSWSHLSILSRCTICRILTVALHKILQDSHEKALHSMLFSLFQHLTYSFTYENSLFIT